MNLAGGNFGWDRNLHLVERFSLFGANTLLYQFEVDDPTAFTQPWKGELTMERSPSTLRKCLPRSELFAGEHAQGISRCGTPPGGAPQH
jgi:hypothetical protein